MRGTLIAVLSLSCSVESGELDQSPETAATIPYRVDSPVIEGWPGYPAWFGHDSSWVNGVYMKRVLAVQFHDTVSATARQQAIASVQGQVVGGMTWPGTNDGLYYVYFPAAVTLESLESIAIRLRTHPAVEFASARFRGELTHRPGRPTDQAILLRERPESTQDRSRLSALSAACRQRHGGWTQERQDQAARGR